LKQFAREYRSKYEKSEVQEDHFDRLVSREMCGGQLIEELAKFADPKSTF